MSDILNKLLEKVENRYYGKYRATVTDNIDPENQGRIKLKVPELLGDDETGWALPCLPYGGFKESGLFFIPEINSNVWVEFEGGNLSYPIWTGTWWGGESSDTSNISEAKVDPDNNIKVLKTRSGHKIEFSDNDKDTKESISIQSNGKHEILLDDSDDQKIQIKSTKGHTFLIDDKNDQIQITSSGGHTFLIDDSGKKIQIKTTNGSEMTMDDGGPGKVTIKDPAGDSIEMDAGASSITIQSVMSLTLKGVDISIESSGMMEVKSSGILTLQGSLININ